MTQTTGDNPLGALGIPILEFDPDKSAIIEPSAWHDPILGLPPRAVMTWMPDAFDRVIAERGRGERYRFNAESCVAPVHEIDVAGAPILVALAPVGAPAAVALLEALVAVGVETVVSVGSSGGLVAELAPGTVVVPSTAIRDEGVSYHYARPSDPARPDPHLQDRLRASFDEAGFGPVTGDVWTTDAIFRETAARVEDRVGQGAVAVDMEIAALATVAAFRGVAYGGAVYLADTLHSDQWDPTGLVDRDTTYRTGLVLAAAAALR